MLILERVRLLGLRGYDAHYSGPRIGWIHHQLKEGPTGIPFHQAVIRLGLQPTPIWDTERHTDDPEQLAPYLRQVSQGVDALVVSHRDNIPALASAAQQLDVPLINASFIASVIETRRRQGYKVDAEHVWIATLQAALGLLEEDDNP